MVRKFKLDWNTANRFMKVSSELPNSDTYHNLGSNALYLITTLPEEERTKEHITSSGETKMPDEMMLRYKRKNDLYFVKLHIIVIDMRYMGIL